MRTIEEIKGHCRIDDEGHWIWAGAVGDADVPAVRAPDWRRDPTGTKTFVQSVTRAVVQISTGKPLRRGMGAYRICTEPGCVRPECIRPMSKKAYGTFCREDGRQGGIIEKRLGAMKRWEGKRKVTPEMARDMMLRPGTTYELAPHYNVDPSTIAWYRRGSNRGANGPFAGLLR